MQNKADIEVLRAFYPLHQPATHKAVYGGRASGKSHWAASYCIMQGTLRPPAAPDDPLVLDSAGFQVNVKTPRPADPVTD